MLRQPFETKLKNYIVAEQDKIYRLAYSYTHNAQDALDVVQTSIEKALAAPEMREPRYIRTWVYRIVVNTAIDLLRAQKRLVWSDDGELEEQAGTEPPIEARLDVRDALDRLPDDLKTIVVLRYFHQLSLQEVADVLSMNLSTTKTRLYRALRLLQLDMEGKHE